MQERYLTKEQLHFTYAEFLERKRISDPATGLREIPPLNPQLFDYEHDIVAWALKRGRAAIFADCGMGKTPMQLEWARHIKGQVLILAPLGVTYQTQREGVKFGIRVGLARNQDQVRENITITNYEMMEHFDFSKFSGIVLDESSILKAHDGKTRDRVIELSQQIPFRLACTATPSPNDYMELGNHAEFLGSMTRAEMLAMFFVHDGGETQKWRIKGHAQADFWRWVCSWAVMIRKPSDLGYSDEGFVLPELVIHEVNVRVDTPSDGFLFPVAASTLQERIRARRDTTADRAEHCAAIVIGSSEQWIIWCGLNQEADRIQKMIPGSVQISGSDSRESKESAIADFLSGKIKILISKVSIFGFGMNLQCCHNMVFLGLSDSYEAFYQAVRRCWRFGQQRTVNVYVITAETEGAVVANIKRKEADAMKMAAEMVEHMADMNKEALHDGQVRSVGTYERDRAEGDGFVAHLGDCVEVVAEIPDESIHYTIYSPPFSSLYTYSNSDRDMGNCKGDDEFMEHYRFLVKQLYRVTMPGRLLSFHCMNLPTSKQNHGYIGIRDFRGELIKLHQEAGFIYHSEVVIWKDPVTAMQRTKALGLLHKQLKKDACMSRQGIPDYLVTMRKPGENPERVSNTAESFPVQLWQQYASPIWMDINPSETLQYRSAREHNDERHICPLQLEVIRRALKLWTNPGDTVLSPFGGIGSEGYCAIQAGRKFIMAELKRSYWAQAVRNLIAAKTDQGILFDGIEADDTEAA